MDTKKYHTQIELEVVPTYHQEPPHIAYGNDGTVINHLTLSQPCVLRFAFDLTPGTHSVFVDFLNKTDADCIPDQGLDKFVTIGSITINKICFSCSMESNFRITGLLETIFSSKLSCECIQEGSKTLS